MDPESVAGRDVVDAVSVPDTLTVNERLGVVPVATIDDDEQGRRVAEALTAGGLTCIEITLRTDAGLSAIAAVRAAHPDMTIGAGTVLDVESARRAIDAGADFVVSPGFDDGVVRWCRHQGATVLPGVVTPTEMMRARTAGVTTVKFFPARASGGVAMLAAVRPVFPELRFVPTGGIGAADLADFLALEHVVAVGGSWMVDRALLDAADWTRVEALASDAVRRVADLRAAP
jgi:2-dehydro-3-deoxyphosphogluconate aldolase/(4S)-4-hydroxy-2-oxoglutarate aldolase